MQDQSEASIFWTYLHPVFRRSDSLNKEVRLATLGPAGTSSECAANYLLSLLGTQAGITGTVDLYRSFELAAQAVLDGTAQLFVVANAYNCVNEMYMNPRLTLVGAFIKDTPNYGVVANGDIPIPLHVRIATHSAPVPLIEELLPPAYLLTQIIKVSSTSEAARMVAAHEVELALTNETSADDHRLQFISRKRPIRMLWSVFMSSSALIEDYL